MSRVLVDEHQAIWSLSHDVRITHLADKPVRPALEGWRG
jgi:hypothetical protein